jgi:hypothetical protein
MTQTVQDALSAQDFRDPPVLLSGTVDYQMYSAFRETLSKAPQTGLVVVELTTLGGDPEVAASSFWAKPPSIPPVRHS